MAVQQITGKRIIKHDTSSPNYRKPEPKIDRKKELKKYESEYLSRLKNNL